MIHTIFFDIDNTLVSHETNCVPQSAQNALSLLEQNGISRIIATGRHISELGGLPLDGLTFDGYLMLNGQLCYDRNRNLLYGNPLTGESLSSLISLFVNHTFPIMLIAQDRMYINFINDRVLLAQEALSAQIPEIDEYRSETVYQAVAFVDNIEKKQLEQLLPNCRIAQWMEYGVDIVPRESGKAAAVRRYLNWTGKSLEGTMAFGDGDNDVDMLKLVQIGIAVGNSVPEAKAAADYITDHIDENGIYNALKHFEVI